MNLKSENDPMAMQIRSKMKNRNTAHVWILRGKVENWAGTRKKWNNILFELFIFIEEKHGKVNHFAVLSILWFFVLSGIATHHMSSACDVFSLRAVKSILLSIHCSKQNPQIQIPTFVPMSWLLKIQWFSRCVHFRKYTNSLTCSVYLSTCELWYFGGRHIRLNHSILELLVVISHWTFATWNTAAKKYENKCFSFDNG